MIVSWGKRTFGGVEYDLCHLDPFTMQVTPKAPGSPTYNVRVTFTCHTFTREWCDTDAPDHKHQEGSEARAFCPIRYGHSQHLEQLIRNASVGKVRFNNQTPWVIPATIPGLDGPYAIYFNAIKARTPGLHVIVDVRSAHHKPTLNMRLPQVTFATVIGNTAAGKPIKRPK
ncbi:hypothetical protein ABOZ73_08565 [Caulobacter sp. 73W]|uniref:Uncharacterized protein n=1 Tax=Caulobacter sp. 73W TaxID=3161137 RepID=A0AB39KXE2_9CAUL